MVLVAGALGAGCSDSGEPFPELHPVMGTVTRDGQPVNGGGLYFAPDPATNTSLTVTAAVNPNGTFEVQTTRVSRNGKSESRPGAPAGGYKVVYHPPSNGSKMGLEVTLTDPIAVSPGTPPLKLVLPELPKGTGETRDDAP
jgi:hypothetical protein